MPTPVNERRPWQQAIVGGCAFVVFVLLTAFLVWLQSDSRSAGQGKEYTHLHCPECLLEMKYLASKEGQPCPKCSTAAAKLTATVGPYKDRHAGVSLVGKTLVAGLISLVIVLALLYGWVTYARMRRQAEEVAANQPLICQCPFCSRKIGYPAHRVGAGTVCPRCKTAFALPEGIVLEVAEHA